MFTATSLSGDKATQYAQLAAQARALLAGEPDRIANAANLSALLYHALPALNWAGFYFYDGTELVVGPFQGLPACVRIPLDKGVCGAAASTRQTQRIEDVHAFPGHIACDAASRSELVVPLLEGVGFEVPEFTEVTHTSAECTDSKPRVYNADGAYVLRNGTEKVLAVVVERQHKREEDKFWTWPVYHATVRSQVGCPTVLLVLCPTDSVARYFTGPIATGYPGDRMTPVVLGPSRTPLVVDPVQARVLPELAVLSAKAHGDADHRALDAVMAALDVVPSDDRAFYYDYVLAGRSNAARKYLEDLMSVETYEWQSDFARKYVGIGREEGVADSVILILEERGLVVSDDVRARVESCDDLNTLNSWVRKAVKVARAEDLFD
jgi:putative methionine-R-sulfoxide reductase with GAF domain